MAGETENQVSSLLIDGKSVDDWEESWELVPNGFSDVQTSLRHVPGLFAAKRAGSIVYIGAAAQRIAGLRAGLARGRLKTQTGNSSNGMKRVREAGDSAETFIIRMMPPITSQDIVALKWALLDRHKPQMNAPRDIVAAARKAAYAKRSRSS